MKKTLIIIAIVSIIGATTIYFVSKKRDKEKTDTKNTDEQKEIAPEITPYTPPAPTQNQLSVTYRSGEGEGKYLVDKTIAEMSKAEKEAYLYDLSLSIADAAKNDVIKTPLKQNPIILPLSIKGLTALKRGEGFAFLDGDVFSNVNFWLSVNTDCGGILLPSLTKNDSNAFLDQFPCKVSGCKRNNKKRNEQVLESGSLASVCSDLKNVCIAAVQANKDSEKILVNQAVEALRKSGFNFLA